MQGANLQCSCFAFIRPLIHHVLQAAWRVIKYDDNLRDFYNRMKKKKGSSKAITATARKLLKKIYYKLTDIQNDNPDVIANQVYVSQGIAE